MSCAWRHLHVKIKLGILVSGTLLSSVISAKAEYHIEIGDTLEIAVAGVPELRQRVAVQLDGSISYPLLDNTFAVAGLAPSEVRARIRAVLPTKVFRQSTSDGRENAVVIEPDNITVNVVEYRPVYVNGDVTKPGEQVYHPLLTVHQAVAVAGGYELMRFRMNNPFLESADFRSDYESLWAEFAKEQVHLWRLKTELGEEKPDQNLLKEIPLPAATLSRIARSEAEQLKGHETDFQHEKEFLQEAIRQTDEEIRVLSDQLQQENAGLQADNQDLQRVTDLLRKNEVPVLRVTDARRALLLSSTRKLQTNSQLLRSKRQRDEFSRQLQRLSEQRNISLNQEAQNTEVKLNQIRSKLQAVGEKIQYTSLIRSQLVRGSGSKPQITVVRKGEKGHRERFLAEDDTELLPGDLVEVVLRPLTPPQLDSGDHQ